MNVFDAGKTQRHVSAILGDGSLASNVKAAVMTRERVASSRWSAATIPNTGIITGRRTADDSGHGFHWRARP